MDLGELQNESERINTQVAIAEKKLQTFDKVSEELSKKTKTLSPSSLSHVWYIDGYKIEYANFEPSNIQSRDLAPNFKLLHWPQPRATTTKC